MPYQVDELGLWLDIFLNRYRATTRKRGRACAGLYASSRPLAIRGAD